MASGELTQMPAHHLLHLPDELWYVVLAYLSPRRIVACRRVCKAWYAFFTDDRLNLSLLRLTFPRCRELRIAAACEVLESDSTARVPHNLRVELEIVAQRPSEWAATFASVARRYHHLCHATADDSRKFQLASVDQVYWKPVLTWDRKVDVKERQVAFDLQDPLWSYSQEDGRLVYPASAPKGFAAGTASHPGSPHDPDGCYFQLFDPETKQHTLVPFYVHYKVLRRVRLAEGVLIFEWTNHVHYDEEEMREQEMKEHGTSKRHAGLRATGTSYRPVKSKNFQQIVTAFDVKRVATAPAAVGKPGPQACWTWAVTHRSQWEIRSPWEPSHVWDHFFSAHTATHYAVYYWSRSSPGLNRAFASNASVFERLTIWDMSRPSSEGISVFGDPRALFKDPWPAITSYMTTLNGPSSGPIVVRHVEKLRSDLAHVRIHQGCRPRLRSLEMDEHNLYFIEEDHPWLEGNRGPRVPPLTHRVKSTSFPIFPFGEARCSPADATPKSRGSAEVLDGPQWIDHCGDQVICRHASKERGVPDDTVLLELISELDSWVRTGNHDPAVSEVSMNGDKENEPLLPWDPPTCGGKHDVSTMVHPRSWPGIAPCWRHDQFPYLTVSEMIDLGAGVRISARDGTTFSDHKVHLRVSLRDSVAACMEDLDDKARIAHAGPKGSGTGLVSGSRFLGSQFSNTVFNNLLGVGKIAGDERWIIGQDRSGSITIYWF